MALTALFLTGYEHGFSGTPANMVLGGGLAGSQAGTTTVASGASARNGAYGLNIACVANVAQWLGHPFTANAKVVARVAIKVTAVPVVPTDGSYIFQLGTDAVGLAVLGTGLCQLDIAGGTPVVGPKINDGAWHVFEFQLDASTGTWTCDWRVDGVAQTRATVAKTAGTITMAELGTHSTNHGAWTANFDDLIVGTWTVAGTDWWGDGKVLGQLAGSDGTHATVADFSPGDAGTIYSGTVTNANTMVDDPPATGGWTNTRSTTDSIGMRVANTAAYMEIAPAVTAQAGQANAVRAIMSYSSSTTLANAAGCVARNSAGAVTALLGTVGGTLASYAVTANNFAGGLLTKPAAGWTAAEVNAVRWRFGGGTSSDISPVPTVQALMLEADWPVPYAVRALLPSQHHRRPQAVHARRGATPTRGQF